MKIYIDFNDKKNELITNEYQSIHSIINNYINIYYSNESIHIDSYYLDYNGIYLDQKNCLEKYNIKDNSTLQLNKEIRGGGTFFNLFAKGRGIMKLLYIGYVFHAFFMGFFHSMTYNF